MSNEEFERIVDFLLRQQAEFDERQARFDERMSRSQAEFEMRLAAYDERMSKANTEFNEKFSRLSDALLSLTNAVEKHDEDIAALTEAGKETDRRMKETDDRLNALIAVVNDVVEKRGPVRPSA
jgi:chromosome segregation ATPase